FRVWLQLAWVQMWQSGGWATVQQSCCDQTPDRQRPLRGPVQSRRESLSGHQTVFDTYANPYSLTASDNSRLLPASRAHSAGQRVRALPGNVRVRQPNRLSETAPHHCAQAVRLRQNDWPVRVPAPAHVDHTRRHSGKTAVILQGYGPRLPAHCGYWPRRPDRTTSPADRLAQCRGSAL